MWYPCKCTDCTNIAANNFRNTAWVESEMGSFPVIHGYLSLSSSGKMGGGGQYLEPTMGLQRSATCGYLPSHHFCSAKSDFEGHQLIGSRLPITDGKAQDQEDDDDILKAKLTIHNGTGEVSKVEDGHKKSRDYSDDSLTPDSTLPPVIRRRNRNRRKKLATSMVEPTAGGVPWEGEAAKPPPRTRSQSISDDQWAQVMAAQTNASTAVSMGPSAGPTVPPGHTPADMSAFAGATTRRGYNTLTRGSGGGGGGPLGRGMVSSASVCDLNSLAQQQPQHGALNSAHAANSFQQLNMMGYGGGMVWGAPCDLCQVMPMYPGHPNAGGMKRAASNLSMNLSSLGSDVSGYPWAPPPPPHIHHHMPMYPGYYPGYHPHMAAAPPPPMGSAMGLNMSIPDSMHTFSKVPSSPAPSVRSSSHRSHKSSKSRSFSAADTSGRRSRNRRMKRSEESEETRSSSASEGDGDDDDRESKGGGGSSLAWQCDHCTFINSGGTRTCGMCSKTVGSGGRNGRRGGERRRSERRHGRRTDQEENDRDLSDYDNDGSGVVKSNLSFNIKDNKREARTKVTGVSKGKSKKKSRRRGGSSASGSDSKSDLEEEERLERHMRDLRVSSTSSRRRGSDHDGVNNRDKDRDRDRGSRKREGNVGRFKNRGKSHSERARTPGRQTPRRSSPFDDGGSFDSSSDTSPAGEARSSQHNNYITDRDGHHYSLDGTLVETLASEATIRAGRKSKSDSSERRSRPKSSKTSSQSSSDADEEQAPEHLPQVPVVNRKYGSVNVVSPSPKFGVRKSKSPELSQRTSRGEGDDPSFANTLDDITTMGTNEVADQDLSSHYVEDRSRSADLLVDPLKDVPVVQYIRPLTPEEEMADEPKTIAVEPIPIRQMEAQKIEVKDEPEAVAVQDTGQVEKKTSLEQLYEPSYETVEQPPEIEAPVMEVKPANHNARDTHQQEQRDHQMSVTEAPLDELRAETERERANADNVQEVKVKQESPIDIRREVARSPSTESSLGLNSSPPHDRQYTPLSFSSSDAQFYSPPDSPDISLSEQLQDKPETGQTQNAPVEDQNKKASSEESHISAQSVRAQEDYYLVTALETMHQETEDNKSLRETTWSSYEQLPYTEEALAGKDEEQEKGGSSSTRPASAGAPIALAPPTDGYESLSFQDALTPSDAARLTRSVSDQALRTAAQANEDAKMTPNVAALLKEAERQSKTMKWGFEDVNEKFLTVEEIITKRRQESMKKQGLQLVQVLRDAEDIGYAPEDVSIALTHCGDKNPLEWLKENWRHMVDTVSTLATNYGQERRVNDVGSITAMEARTSLRHHKGNIWAAVTECVEQRQKKFNEIYSRGHFKRENVVRALESHDGDADAAFLELNRSQLQPFMMKIWNPLLGLEKPAPKTVSPTLPAPMEVQSPAPTSTQQDVRPVPAKLDLPRPTQIDVPRPAQEGVPQPLTQTNAIKEANQTQPAEFEEEEDTDDEDDVFENTYANIDPVREEPPKKEPIYATVQKKSKEKSKETDTQKLTKLAKKDDRPQDRRPLTPNRNDLTPTDDDELFSASEVAEPESEEDLEEFEDTDEGESDSETEEPQVSRAGGVLASPTAPSDQMDALSDSASGESQEEKEEEETRESHQDTPMLQYVRKEDVVVHPLKAFTHYADLSVSEYSEEPRSQAPPDSMTSPSISSLDTKSPACDTGSPPPNGSLPSIHSPRDEAVASSTPASQPPSHHLKRTSRKTSKYSSTLHVSLSTQNEVYEHTTDKTPVQALQPAQPSVAELRAQGVGEATVNLPLDPKDSSPHLIAPVTRPKSKSAPNSVRNSFVLEDCSESEEEESVSVTTGRLSLSLSASSINVKSESIQTEQVVATEHAQEKECVLREIEEKEGVKSTPAEEEEEEEEEVSAMEGGGRSPGSDEESEEQQESEEQHEQEEEREEPQEAEEPEENGESQTRPVVWPPEDQGMAQTRPGPVTLQKATVIVGKAIAKAMARETSVRESNSRSVTPEVQETPVATPEPSEEEEITAQVITSDSDDDDDDHLRPLDTILEEEEISEMTESGRVISRPASKNLFLPFNPTDVMQLSTADGLKSVPEPKTSSVSKKDPSDETVSVTSKEAAGVDNASVLNPAEEKTPRSPQQSLYSAPPHTYYNEAAAIKLKEEQAIKLAPDDYETMYEVKRQLDDLRDTSSATLDKINALVSERAGPEQEGDDYEEVYYDDFAPKPNDIPSKDPESEPSSATTSSKRRRRRRRQKARGSSKDAGASSRAEVSESSVASSSPAPPSPGAPSPPQTPSPVVPTPSPAPTTPPPIQPPSEATPATVQEDATEEVVATVTVKTGRKRPTPTDTVASTSQPRKEGKSPLKTEPAAKSGSIRRRRDDAKDAAAVSPDTQAASHATPTPSTSSTKNASPAIRTRKTSLPESSGESEDEDRVSVVDHPKIPHLLVKVEGLKARHDKKNPDYQEVRELKEQIQIMRRQLEAQIEDADDRPETPESPKEEEQLHKDPDIALKESPEKPVGIEYEQLLFDRKVRRLLAEGQAGSYEKAELAAHLLAFNFNETDSLQAAEECSSIYTAIQFLQQECELCAEKYPMRKMMSMLQCTHRCCCECAKTYFTFQIKTKNIREVRCPFCSEPDLDANEEIANEYLNNMDILLKNILDEETHELFQRKLRDWTLMKDPNFRWCNKCSSGFIANPRARKLICPDCKDVTCAHCRATWEATHEGISCEAFARWKTDNDAEIAAQGVAKHLAECGITCPKCKFTYSLAKGGCMHFTCTQCKYEFCSGCSHPFRQGSKCSVGPYCERLGLHAHHPRNCLFYLRDKDPLQLQNLLKEAGVKYDTEPQGGKEQKIGVRPMCQVQEQKELPDGLKDDVCGRIVPSGYAGLCRLHYTEYLVEKINTHKLDPVSIFDEADLRVCLRRNGKTVPIRRWESEKLYRDKLIKLIKEHLPLSNID